MSSLADHVVIVTGASSGIGAATARLLGAGGAKVVLFARRRERLDKLAAEVDPSGARVLCVAGDLTNPADRQGLVDAALARFGRIDALVNNAGYGQRGPIESVSLDAIRGNFETNVFALLGLVQLVAPILRRQGGGRIVNVGSVAGRIARPLTSVYDATKHALEAFTDGLRGELKPFNIQVVLVRPGFIMTEFTDAADAVSREAVGNPGPYAPFSQSMKGGARKLKPIAGQPEDVARVIQRALTTSHPKTHYAVPKHALLFLFLRWLLPVRAIDWLVRLRR